MWRSALLAAPAGYALAAVGVLGVSLVIAALLSLTDRLGLSLLYIPVVLGVAVLYGRGPGVAAALLASGAFDYLFGIPRFSFAVEGPQEWIGLGVFLATALVTGALSAEVRRRAREAAQRELEARVLRALGQALDAEDDPTALEQLAEHVLSRELGQPVTVRGGVARVAGEPGSHARLLDVAAAQVEAATERARLRAAAAEADILRHSDELKTSLLHAVSNDVRTPLAAIKAAAGSLGAEDLRPDERGALGQLVEREVDRLNGLVANLLDLSRIEAGAVRPRKEVYPLVAVVDDVVARLAPGAPDHTVLVDVPEQLPPVPLDYVQVDRVLTNLLENAFRHTPSGTEVCITAAEEDGVVRVTVADTGPGVPPDALGRLFERFAGSVARPGLGLAVVKGLVEAHGGRAWAEPRPGGGLAVRFTLPLEPSLVEAR